MSPAPREDERIVRRAVHLALEDLAGVGEGVARRAVDLRHAAQGVVVLDAAAAAVRFADRAAGEERPQVGRALHARRGAAARRRSAGRRPRPSRARRRGRRRRRGRPRGESSIARWSARPPTATDIWTPLMSARPSLAPSATGADPRAPRAPPPAVLSRPRTRTRPSPMSAERQVRRAARDRPTPRRIPATE